jgi:hypothetical protein
MVIGGLMKQEAQENKLRITLESKFTIGEKVGWNAPYGWETVTIKDIKYDRVFKYLTEEYTFWIDEIELG